MTIFRYYSWIPKHTVIEKKTEVPSNKISFNLTGGVIWKILRDVLIFIEELD
jgi:hypothetical protein